MKTLLTACSVALMLSATAATAQEGSGRLPRTLDLQGRIVTVPSPLVVDNRDIAPIATPLRFDDTYFNAINNAVRVNISDFPLDRTTTVDLELETFDVFDPNAELVRGTADGLVPVARPQLATLRGSIVGIPGSKVYLAISPNMSNGFLEFDGTTYIVSNGSFELQTGITIYNLTDLPEGQINWIDYACTLIEAPGQNFASRGETSGGDDVTQQPCRVAKVAIEADTEFSQLFMSQDPMVASELTMEYIESLVGGVTQIYTDNWNMRLSIVYTRIWPDATIADPWMGTDTPSVLDEMNETWREFDAPYAGEWHGAHHFSGKPLGGGIAYLATFCYHDLAQAVSGNLNGFFPTPIESNLPQNWDLVVTAHEWGHNFGAPHTHGLIPPVDQCAFGSCGTAENGTIMSYCHLCPGGLSNIALFFHQRILENIIQYVSLEIPTLPMPCDLTPQTQEECDGGTIDCIADINGDGMLTPTDFTAWIVAYNAGDLAADCNRNGTLEPADFSAWVASWVAGCDF
ncbi:MAG: hypothetical protein H6808_03470 [Phycisphaera sp.]|nr:hypothetical protein [Phycisphaera sp.]